MKIVLTGGGSGGHFYPLIAVAEEINKIVDEQKILKPDIYFLSDKPYDQKALFDNDIVFKKVTAGKLRQYFSIRNIFDPIKTGWGVIRALFTVFWIYPDVVFSKGGYASFPAVIAARMLRIPVVIHESDSVPGRANRWAGKFAKRIAVSYQEAATYFTGKNVALTGNPVRASLRSPSVAGAHELLRFDRTIPTILALGGSQGAEKINNAILDSLSELTKEYQIIHQAGSANLADVQSVSSTILRENEFSSRYRVFDFLHDDALRAAVAASDLIISRAGAGALSEIALWAKPSIIIPITSSNGDHQRKNALAYAKNGACIVIEEENLKPHILISEIRNILGNQELQKQMAGRARATAQPDAAEKIARTIISIALKHEI